MTKNTMTSHIKFETHVSAASVNAFFFFYLFFWMLKHLKNGKLISVYNKPTDTCLY